MHYVVSWTRNIEVSDDGYEHGDHATITPYHTAIDTTITIVLEHVPPIWYYEAQVQVPAHELTQGG